MRMALKIRCEDERGEVKNECGVRVILGIREGTQAMRAGGETNRIESEDVGDRSKFVDRSGRG